MYLNEVLWAGCEGLGNYESLERQVPWEIYSTSASIRRLAQTIIEMYQKA